MPPLIEDAGRNGLIVGAFVLAFFVLCSFGGLLGLLGMASGLAGMVWLVRQQMSRDRESIALTGKGVPGPTLTCYGIAMSFFAALPVCLIIYVALKFIWPTFIIDRMRETIEILSQVNEYQPLASEMENLIEHGLIPGAADMMGTVMIMMMLTGIVIGIIGAIIVKVADRQWRSQ